MDYSKSYMKAVFLLSLNGLEIHLMSLLLGSFRITFIDGQKHLKSLLLLPNIVCVCVCVCVENTPCLSRSLGNIV